MFYSIKLMFEKPIKTYDLFIHLNDIWNIFIWGYIIWNIILILQAWFITNSVIIRLLFPNFEQIKCFFSVNNVSIPCEHQYVSNTMQMWSNGIKENVKANVIKWNQRKREGTYSQDIFCKYCYIMEKYWYKQKKFIIEKGNNIVLKYKH